MATWIVVPKKDRLNRLLIVDEASSGRGKTVIAENIRIKEIAALIIAAPKMLEVLGNLLEVHVDLINSGDCGNWNPETDEEVIAARKILAEVSCPS